MKIPEFLVCKACNGEFVPEVFLNHLQEEHNRYLDRDVCVHVPIYNDAIAYARTAKNVSDHNLFCITDDGRFPGFKQINKSDNSTDGTKKIADSYLNVVFFEHGVNFEESKFNYAFHLAAKMGFNYVILLGSDEWIVGDIGKLKRTLNQRLLQLSSDKHLEEQIFQVAIDEHQPENKWNRFITESPKVFYNPGLIRTRFTHWLRYSTTQIARDKVEHPFYNFQRRICDIVIHHDDSIRGTARNDLMTKFQDKNVQREKKRIQNEAFRKLFQFTFFLSDLKLADWHKSFFLEAKENYSHYIIYDQDVKLTRKTVNQIHACLLNNVEKNIDVLCGVWKLSDDKRWRASRTIPNSKFYTEKMREIYTNAKYDPKVRLYSLTLALGPVMAIKKSVVKEVSTISDKKKFLEECMAKQFKIMCDSGIQIKLEEQIAAIQKAN